MTNGDNSIRKILIPNPIIPAELYIHRYADRQLRRIVDEMGRPGYVLVARQMGKTNLLLNAKRELESPEDCFLYLDVSNLFPDISSFFRNVIDTILDTYPEKMESVVEIVKRRRESRGLPHKEHELELRDILRAIKGKLIICLDEIDALTKTNYSDEIFSFLRSVYFSGRTNFPELRRLTYVLSGVAEPSALIKNKDVSPFNIGEKILLEDFTFEESKGFIEKAGLGFCEEVGERIFHWMGGNPRMTWDICSALEDLQIEQQSISVADVDDCVSNVYLTNFDVPPIDHLRTLAEDDKEIRQAIMSLHYGKADSISDAIKSRLYLHGYIRLGDKASPVRIKNRVIEEALSESWLKDVEQSKISLLDRVDRMMREGRYAAAIDQYDEFIKTVSNTEDYANFYSPIGRCYLEVGRYADALEYFNKAAAAVDQNEYPKEFLKNQYHIGVCLRELNRLPEALERLNSVIEEGNSRKIKLFYFDALVTLSSTYLSMEEYEKVIHIADSITGAESEVRDAGLDNAHANEVAFAAMFNASLAEEKLSRLDNTKDRLAKCLEYANAKSKVEILLRLAIREENIEKKKNYLETCARHILDSRLPISVNPQKGLIDFYPETFLDLLVQLAEQADSINRKLLIDYLLNDDIESSVPLFDIVSLSVFSMKTPAEREVALCLIDEALGAKSKKLKDYEPRLLLMYKQLLIPFEEIGESEQLYWDTYWRPDNAVLVDADYRLIFHLVRGHLDKGNPERARAILDNYYSLQQSNNFEVKDEGVLIIQYLETLYRIYTEFTRAVLQDVVSMKNKLDASSETSTPVLFGKGLFKELANGLAEWMKGKSLVEQFRRSLPKIGRNEMVKVRFVDGRIIEAKFKSVMRKIADGECEFVELVKKNL